MALLLFIHLVASAVWFGGGVMLAIAAVRAELSGSLDRVHAVGAEMGWFGAWLLVPCAAVVLVSGVALASMFEALTRPWVLIALSLFALSGTLALVFLAPRPRLAALVALHGPGASIVQRRARLHFWFNRIEVAILLVVLVDMIVKPG